MAFLVFTIISTFLGQALNGKRCSAVAQKLDKMSTIAVIVSQYLNTMNVFTLNVKHLKMIKGIVF